MGVCVNILTGYLIVRVQLRTLVVVSALVTMAAAPIMATADMGGSYWQAAFWGLLLSPINADGRLVRKRATMFITLTFMIISPLHRLKPRHFQCIPTGTAISCGRCLQRDLSIW